MITETDVQNAVRLASQAAGGVAGRNNVGAVPDDRGSPVRFGLGNDSAALNRVFKMGDLVGIMPTRAHTGPWGAAMTAVTMGIFIMLECKEPAWKWRATPREVAQWEAIIEVRRFGGRAGFVTGPEMAVAVAHGAGLGAYNG